MDIEQTELDSRLTEALRLELQHLRHLVRRARAQGVSESDIFDRVFDNLGLHPASGEISRMLAALVAREIKRELRGDSS